MKRHDDPLEKPATLVHCTVETVFPAKVFELLVDESEVVTFVRDDVTFHLF